nr:transporter [Ruegeria lacuscaerulensis]
MFALVFLFVTALPLSAQTVAELQAELEAQKQTNALLKQRIQSLEKQLAATRNETRDLTTPVATTAALPADAKNDPLGDRALERALVRRGNAVLAPGVIEITPSITWAYSGRDAVNSTDESIIGGLDARMGLQNGWMIGARTSLWNRDISGFGSNDGLGDTELTVWKEIGRGGSDPSIVASLSYSAPTGDDFSQDLVPLGSGFHELAGRLSVVKTIAPVALFGDISYRYRFSDHFNGVKVERAPEYGLGFGGSLAITPDVSSSVSLRYLFEDDVKSDGVSVPGTSMTTGILDFGLGVVLKRDLFLNLNAAFGVTDDAPDTVLSVSAPFRF